MIRDNIGTATGAALDPDSPAALEQERFLLWTLAAIQFTHILDFMIVMPLGPRFMEIFAITPGQFGIMVSTYTYSAGFFSLAAAFFIDRFDRKKALLWLYAGFAVGTLACALAPSYPFLVAARFFAGGFGGVAGATLLAILADRVPMKRRGAAMGTLFTSFSVASVAGVPFGLLLADHLGWHAPFFLIAILAVPVWIAAQRRLPTMRGHIRPGAESRPWQEMKAILGKAGHWRAFSLTVVMTAAGFLIVPYISPSLVANAGVANNRLFLIYLAGGAATFFSLRFIGRLGDRLGLRKVFIWVSLIALFPMAAMTAMPPLPLWIILAVTTAFMVFTSGRFAPGMALISGSVEPRLRGGFMNINSALQQLASGAAAMVSGAIVVQGADGTLDRFPWVGGLSVLCILISLWLVGRLPALSAAPALAATPQTPPKPQ